MLHAQSTWDGSDSALWSTAGNWDTAPTAGSSVIFPAGAANLAVSVDTSPVVGTLTISSGANTSLTGTVGPQSLTINSGVTTSGAAGTYTIASTNSFGVVFGGNNAWNLGRSLTVNAPITDGASSFGITKTGTGSLTLGGNNSFNGGIDFQGGGTVNLTGSASNTSLGDGTFTFNAATNVNLAVNANISKTIANHFIQNQSAALSGTQYAQLSHTTNVAGNRVQQFTGNFSTGANFFGGNGSNNQGQSIFMNALGVAASAAAEGTFIFTGDWSAYDAVTSGSGATATTNTQAFRLQSGSFVFDKSASTHSNASAGSAGGFLLQGADTVVSGKLILSESTSDLKNGVNFAAGTVRHSLGSRAGTAGTVTASGNIAVSSAAGGNIFAQDATEKLTVTGQVTGTGAGGLEINKPYAFTSADSTNATETPTGTVELSRLAGNTYSGGTTVTAGTLLVNNTSNSGTGTGAVTVATGAKLGGTGRIAPTLTSGVTVNGTVDLKDAATADLDIDLAGTGNAVFSSGAKFSMELGAPSAADVVDFAGLSDSTVTFNGNAVDLTGLAGVASGTYTLFTFDTASAYSGTLSTGTLAGGITGASFNYNATDITVTITASGATPYATWAGGALFDDDANNDGVDNGLAWMLGAGSPTDNALGLLPTATVSGGNLTLSTFNRVDPKGPAKLFVEYSNNLTSWTSYETPSANGVYTSGNFTVTIAGTSPQTVAVTVSSAAAAGGGKLFARLRATEN
jgi:autotransporter-associated beta strand protein